MQFGSESLLRNANLSVQDRECLVLIGPSGSGKSVILKLFAGILNPHAGRVFVEKSDLAGISESERTQLLLKMGMLFQKNALFDSLTVGDNIAFPLRETTELPDGEIGARVDFFLEAVGLTPAKALFPHEISGGMQKRLGIARALALNPQTVLYDDPTAGLDPITSRKIVDLILDLKSKNKSTVIAVTNDMARAFQLGDRIAMIVDQNIVITGNKEQTMNHSDSRVRNFVRGRHD
jgi:phospholipid/cholesterol/gamma-HCH transport system ATP-binding protein